MSMDEKIRSENKEISESILRIMKDVKTNYAEKEKTKLQELEIEKNEKYAPDNLFKDKPITDNKGVDDLETNSSITKYKKSIFTKFITKIKKLFNIQ